MSKPAKIIQIVLLAAIVIAGLRFYLAMRSRHDTFVAPKQKEVALDADAYVVPKRLHPQDLQDAKELTRQPVWVREGYRFVYYPYQGQTDFKHPAGKLGPIEKLEIEDVVVDRPPAEDKQVKDKQVEDKQVMAVFEKDGGRYAFPIGVAEGGGYRIYSDDILFIQDPHELYKHWPAEVWQAIESHQVKPGMNELQASFAVGVGTPEGEGTSNPRVVNYPNNGHPLRVTYDQGKATNISETTAS